MRRTDQEFKAEVQRRSREYQKRRAQKRKKLLGICSCLVVCVLAIGVFWPGVSVANKSGLTADCAAPESAEMNSIGMVMDEGEAYDPQEPAAVDQDASTAGDATEAAPQNGDFKAQYSVSESSVVSVEIFTQPELEEYRRHFTDPGKIGAIVDAIGAFYELDTPAEKMAGLGETEGMAYVIIVTDEQGEHRYTLFNDGLASEEDGCWIGADHDAYRALEQLITQEGD